MIGLETNPRISVTGDSIAYAARCPSLSSPFREYGRVVSYAVEGVASGVYLYKHFFVFSITHTALISHHKITGGVPWLLHVGFSHGWDIFHHFKVLYLTWKRGEVVKRTGRRIEIMPHSYEATGHYRG